METKTRTIDINKPVNTILTCENFETNEGNLTLARPPRKLSACIKHNGKIKISMKV